MNEMNRKIQETQMRLNWIASYKDYLTQAGVESLYNLFEAEDAYETGKSPREAGDRIIAQNKALDVLSVEGELNELDDEDDTIQGEP